MVREKWESRQYITDITVNTHRNGIRGRAFTAITFTFTDPEALYYNGRLTAIVPDADGYELHDVECYVIHTSKPDLCYRGDRFDNTMAEIIKAHNIGVRQQLDAACKRPDKSLPIINAGITHFKDMGEVHETINPNVKQEPDKKVRSTRFSGIIE